MAPKVKHLGDNPEATRKLALGEYPVGESPQPHKSELAEVMAFNPSLNSYIVVTRGSGGNAKQPGRRQLRGIPRMVDRPGRVSPLSTGTVVVINWELGFPYIAGVLNVNTVKADVEGGVQEPMTVGEGVSASVNKSLSETDSSDPGYYRFPGTPEDVVGGDWMEITPDGNYVGAFRRNYNVMSAGKGHKAKFEQFGEKDLTRLTTGDHELITDFGVLEIYNEEGRCGLSFRAAADQLNESGGKEQQWTFKLDIGDQGDFFNMEVLDTAQKTKAKFHISADGRVTLIGVNGLDLINGGTTPKHEETAGPVIQRFLDKFTSYIEGAFTQEIKSSRTIEVSEIDKKIVGGIKSLSVNSNEFINVGGNRQEVVTGGSPLLASPLNVAIESQILNGSYHLEVGNPSLGSNPLAQAGMTFAVNNGDIVLGQNPKAIVPAVKARVSLNSFLSNSIALGGLAERISNNPALFHAVLYEVLQPVLSGMMAMFDSHVHVPPGNTPPTVLMTPLYTLSLLNMQSQRVLIGL